LDEICKILKETIQRVATNTIGYTRKQANKEWFKKECAKVNRKRTPPKSEPSKSTPEEPIMFNSQDEGEAVVQKKGQVGRQRGFNQD
jgi:hypothetical protein